MGPPGTSIASEGSPAKAAAFYRRGRILERGEGAEVFTNPSTKPASSPFSEKNLRG